MLYPKLGVITSLGLLSMLLCCYSQASSQGGAHGGGGRERLSGEWWAKSGNDEGKIHLSFKREGGGGWSSADIPLSQLQGLEPSQISAGGMGLRFRLMREAGTILFEGSFKEGKGAGRWEFDGNAGLAFESGKGNRRQTTAEELFALALSDVTASYVREMEGAGYSGLEAGQLVALYTNGVRAGYVEGLAGAGYAGLGVKELIALKSNGISAEDAKAYSALLDGETGAMQFVALKSNQVTEAYLRSLAEVGVRPTASQAIALHTNGVTPEFVRSMQARGYDKLTVQRLLSLRINGAGQ
jgi:hypothetical protein